MIEGTGKVNRTQESLVQGTDFTLCSTTRLQAGELALFEEDLSAVRERDKLPLREMSCKKIKKKVVSKV